MRRLSEAGYSMAWWAAFLGFILAPLMSVSVDLTRLMFVRTDLQTSVDAACEAAAQAGDNAYFNRTGEHRIHSGLARSYASQAFGASTSEAGIVVYSPALTSVSLVTPVDVACTAHASVQPFIPFSPALNIKVAAQSRMRYLEQ